MAMSLRIVVPPHPLIAHWLTMLRNSKTPPPLYATGFEELGKWLTYEAIRDWLPNRQEKVETETSETIGQVIESNIPLISIAFKAGGFQLWQGARNVLPNSNFSMNGIPQTIEKNAGLIVFIDQITTGEFTEKILCNLVEKGVDAKRLRLITALSCSEGLKRIAETMPNLIIYCACIDSELKDTDNINPGIGNPSLRLNTIISSWQ